MEKIIKKKLMPKYPYVLLGITLATITISIIILKIPEFNEEIFLLIDIILLFLLLVVYSVLYTDEDESLPESVILRKPKIGEVITILYKKNVEEDDMLKCFYVYSIKEYLFIDEAEEGVSVEVEKKYFVTDDNKLVLYQGDDN